MTFDHPWLLLLLLLAILPWLTLPGAPLVHSWIAMLPRDRPSDWLGWAVRSVASITLIALVIALAGPYRAEYTVVRRGTGAEIVLLLDRSGSMDQGFGGVRIGGKSAFKTNSPEALDFYSSLNKGSSRDSKGKVARRLLAEFAAKRPADRFGMIAFSTLPIQILDFTQKSEVVQAAIEAANIGRGLSETDIGLALDSALNYFDHRAYTGSRIILLVSDGGDHLDDPTRERIAIRMRQNRVSLYWIYIRSSQSPGLIAEADEPPSNADVVPEYFLHRYFQTIGVPYHAYEADNPEALQKAVADVDRLENLPISYDDTVPRRDLSQWFYGAACAALALLAAAHLLEIGAWR